MFDCHPSIHVAHPPPPPCRVPTSAVEELPPFVSEAAPRALQRLQQEQQERRLLGLGGGVGGAHHRGPLPLLAFVPAKPPPSRAATDAWLAERRRRRRRGRPAGSGGGGADFRMDPNTGKLLPAGAAVANQGRPGSAASLDEAGQGTPGSLLGDGDLLGTLGTPSFSTLGGSGSGSGDGGGSRVGTPTSAGATPADAPPAGACLGISARTQQQQQQGGVNEDEAAEEHVAPPSPKYDEGAFVNPFPSLRLTQRPPSRRRQPTQQQRHPGSAGSDAEQTPAGQRVPASRLSLYGAGSVQLPPQQPRPSRLSAAAAADTAAGSQEAGGSEVQQPGLALLGSPPATAQLAQAQAQARPSGSLLKSLLRSAIKAPAGRGAEDGSQEQEAQHLRRPHFQGSEGSSAKRVSFAAARAAGGSGGGTPGGGQGLPAEGAPPQQLAEATTGAAGGAAAGPSQQTAGGTASDGPTAATEYTLRPQQRFISQLTLPSPGLGGGTAPGATPLSQAGFKQRRCVAGKGQQLTLLSLELHAESRWGRMGQT